MLSAYLDRTLLKQVTPESRKISYKTLFNSTENLETLKNIMTNEYMLKMGALPKFLNTLSKTFGYSHSTTFSQFPISQVRLYILI